MEFPYISLICGFVFIILSVRNLIWSKRFASGKFPFKVENPKRVLLGFKKLHIVGFTRACGILFVLIGVSYLVYILACKQSDILFKSILVTFPTLSFAFFIYAFDRYIGGYLLHVEKLARKEEGAKSPV